jgi:hypothetical protein
MPHRGRWTIYAGMQTFYFTPLKVKNASCHDKLKYRMRSSKQNFKVKVAWIPLTKDSDREVIDALSETAFKRLAPLTSFWQPLPEELDKMQKREMSQYLFLELVKAMQGARIAFQPFSSSDMASVTPWNEEMLEKVLNETGCSELTFDDCVVLGIRQPTDDKPFIILVYFLYEALAHPEAKSKAPGLKNATRNIFTDTLDNVKTLKNELKGNPNSVKRNVIALYSGKSRYEKEIMDSLDSNSVDLIKHLASILKLKKLSNANDLAKLGMLGGGSFIVLPCNK